MLLKITTAMKLLLLAYMFWGFLFMIVIPILLVVGIKARSAALLRISMIMAAVSSILAFSAVMVAPGIVAPRSEVTPARFEVFSLLFGNFVMAGPFLAPAPWHARGALSTFLLLAVAGSAIIVVALWVPVMYTRERLDAFGMWLACFWRAIIPLLTYIYYRRLAGRSK